MSEHYRKREEKYPLHLFFELRVYYYSDRKQKKKRDRNFVHKAWLYFFHSETGFIVRDTRFIRIREGATWCNVDWHKTVLFFYVNWHSIECHSTRSDWFYLKTLEVLDQVFPSDISKEWGKMRSGKILLPIAECRFPECHCRFFQNNGGICL